MHQVYRDFVERLLESVDAVDLRNTMVAAATALDLPAFAYLSLPHKSAAAPQLISNYPPPWRSHYLQCRYETIDPVLIQARRGWDPFLWGQNVSDIKMSASQQQLFDEAAEFGIRYGFTIPIHGHRGQFAALTFAVDECQPKSLRAVRRYEQLLHLMAVIFNIHVRRTLVHGRIVDGVQLSPRQFECLQWAARGKSAWEIGCILGISERTAAYHLDNVRAKLGVRTIYQAVARLAASNQYRTNR